LSLEQLYISHLIKGLTKEEKQAMVKMMTDEFIASLNPKDQKELVKILLPDIVDRLIEGMTISDRKELVELIMTLMTVPMGKTKNAARDNKENRSNGEDAKERHR
jgi:hypothetical protein